MKLHDITTLLRERVVRDGEWYDWGGSAGFSDEQYRQAAERIATKLEDAYRDVDKESIDDACALLHDRTFQVLLSEATDIAVTIWDDERRDWYAEDPDAPDWVDSALSEGFAQPPANETELLRVLGAAIYLQLEAANEAVLAWLAKTIEEAE